MNDIRCAEIVELVTDFLDGSLDEPAGRRFADHLPGCRGCERYVEQVRQIRRLLRGQATHRTLLPATRAALLGAALLVPVSPP